MSEIIAPGFDSLTPGSVWSLLTATEWQYAPRNLGEGYRYSVPTLYYTYDPSFLNYFGSNGVRAVDSAFAILNRLTNVDSYSSDLSEFPLDEGRFNHTAAGLHLFDLKSAALEMLVTELGLADSERWTWCLRNRQPIPSLPCPFFVYSVIQRNFDPITWAPSKYVNGNLFTYSIEEICPPGFDRQDPVEILVDPLDTYQPAVSATKITHPNILYYGFFHTGLTRDDVGGLRYLYSANNRNVEQAPSDAFRFTTNRFAQLLFTSNLTAFAAAALTNRTTNVTPVFTNFPFDPVGSPQHLVFTTNLVPFAQTFFHHTFANVAAIQASPSGFVPVQFSTVTQFTNRFFLTFQNTTISFQSPPFSTFPVLTTNTITRTILTNGISGEFFILPTNSCDVAIIGTLFTNITFETNVTASATNTFTTTNAVTGVQSFQSQTIDIFTNHWFVIFPITCDTNTAALRSGLQRISFVRHDFDSLLNRFFYPITNDYTMVAVTNNLPVIERFRRIITRPDFLFTAADIGPNDVPIEIVDRIGDVPNFVTATNAASTNGAAGTIEGPVTFTFNKVGPIRLNTGPDLIDEEVAILYFIWGSFDGTTNAPFIYGGETANSIQNQLLITVSPSSLPDGTALTPYSVPLSVTGGLTRQTAPTRHSPALPPCPARINFGFG